MARRATAERSAGVGATRDHVVEHTVHVVVGGEVRAQGCPGESGGAAVVGPEGEDENDEGGEGDDDVHGRKSALIMIPPRVAELTTIDKILPSVRC